MSEAPSPEIDALTVIDFGLASTSSDYIIVGRIVFDLVILSVD